MDSKDPADQARMVAAGSGHVSKFEGDRNHGTATKEKKKCRNEIFADVQARDRELKTLLAATSATTDTKLTISRGTSGFARREARR
jgi:hypothetical protein